MALQSTGVYWIPLYDILEERGFEVYLVNARHTKNLPGRKSDVQESQWLLKLHTYGLLEQFVPTNRGDSGAAHLLAATGRTCAWNGDVHSTDAESANANEPAIGKRDQRSEWSRRTKDRACHPGWRARSARAGGT